MEGGCCDLYSPADSEVKPVRDLRVPKDYSRSKKCLLFPVMGSTGIEGRVLFKHRPELPLDVVLECRIPHECTAQEIGSAGRKTSAEGILDVEGRPAFGKTDGGG